MSLAAIGLTLCVAMPAASATIGLVADPDPTRQEQLVRGAQLALGAGPRSPQLAVGRSVDHWSGVTAEIEELIDGRGADVLVAPADARTAHLVAQIATRRHLPAIATAARGTLTATGSWWLVTCEWNDHDSALLARHLGRPPSEWEMAGWSAVQVATMLLDAPSRSWSSPDSGWRDRLPASCHEREAQHDEHDG